MPRAKRIDVGGYCYHVLNRGNGRMTLFEDEDDYAAFERVLVQSVDRFPGVGLIAYCLMPNHWHMVIRPEADGQMGAFLKWLTGTHTARWHAHRHTVGGGHIYQGRYKSFLVGTESYLTAVCRYVERNPVRAGLVQNAQAWWWSSLRRWHQGSAEAKRILAPWPAPGGKRPPNWVKRVNTPETQEELDVLRLASNRGRPYGDTDWQRRVMLQFGLESTFRSRGRPKKTD